MADKKFQRFGKYLILDHLVDGGMAKICRARFLGEQANKVVAIKMVQPQFSNDETFSRMFQDELNITFGMLHPNIMQVYDYGKTDGQLYTAMEYIHGANLKQYIDRLKERRVVFPVEISCYIISQVCLGLHYAHTFTDKLTGKPYNIVHRDISPHNIMLSYDGAVKVIDFGIAKANTNSEATQAGTIKGKLSYLAPEYLEGLELDARYDEFAVGITLWELLCSRKLFQANNDLAVLKQIQACKITPPSEINPSVPKELDMIVMKALSKDRSQRYENLDQLNRALVRFLYSRYPEFNPSDLRVFADDLFKNEIEKDVDRFVDYGKIDVTQYIEEMKRKEARTGKIQTNEIREVAKKEPQKPEAAAEFELMTGHDSLQLDLDKKLDKTASKKLSRQSIPSGKTSVQSRSATTIHGKRDRSTESKLINRKELKESEKKSSPMALVLAVAVGFGAVAYFNPQLVGLETSHPSRDPSSVKVTSKVEENQKGRVVLGGVDFSMQIFVNGSKVEYSGKPVEVPLNKKVQIIVKKRGYRTFATEVELSESKNSMALTVPKLERAKMGLLTTSENYAAGSKLVFDDSGEKIEKELPFSDLEIPEGSYRAKVVNPILGTEKEVEFNIEENKKHFLE